MSTSIAPRIQQARVPTMRSSFIGREREVTEVCELLLEPQLRLLTLSGAGGIGKTRLSIEVAMRLEQAFPGDVHWVALAPVTDPDLVMATIGQSLGISDFGQHSVEDRLGDALQDHQSLIVLDNFEQVAEAAPRIADLVEQCPKLTVLITSRIPLKIRAERVYPVQPLAVPSINARMTSGDAQPSESARLFVERARLSRQDFKLTSGNEPAIAEICRRLEGVPLAIELAAARANVLSPQGMLTRLKSSLSLLVGGPRDQPVRLQSMRGAIQWSWDLLTLEEQALLCRMAVFRGGSTLESLEAVVGDDLAGDVLGTLSTLIDHNLIRSSEDPDGNLRFDMHVVVREFALEQLALAGEVETTRNRHGDYFIWLAETAGEHYYGSEATRWLDGMDREHDNIRAALEFYAATGANHRLLQLASAAGEFWYWRGHLREGRRWLELALGNDDGADPLLRAMALSRLADLAQDQGDYQFSYRCAHEALEISRHIGHVPSTFLALHISGIALWMMGETLSAHRHLDEALGLARDAGNLHDVELVTWLLSYSALILGDLEQAARLNKESLALARDAGDKVGIACGEFVQGWLEAYGGNHDRAWALLLDGAKLSSELGDVLRCAYSVDGLAAVSAMRNRPHQTAILAGAAAAARNRLGRVSPLSPSEGELTRSHRAAARSQLGESQWDLLFAQGHAMTLEEALEYAATPQLHAADEVRDGHQLTPRQIEVLRLVAEGLSDKEIAEQLFISPHTVMRHVANILNALGVESRTAAATYALRNNLL